MSTDFHGHGFVMGVSVQDIPTQRPSAWHPTAAARPVGPSAWHPAVAPRPTAASRPVSPVSFERHYVANRPSRLFEQPEPARVIALVPDGPPKRIEWRGDAALIRAARGPQRLAAPWWEPAPLPQRDYFEVQLESGRVLWLFRERESGDWFVHGEWS